MRATFLLDPVGGASAGGSSFVVQLSASDDGGGNITAIQDNENVTGSWSSVSQHTYSTHVNPQKYAIIDFDETTLTNQNGVIHLRLARVATSGSDNYPDGLCFTGCKFNFYR